MRRRLTSPRRSLGSWLVTALALSGVGLIAVALTDQQHAVPVPLSSPGSGSSGGLAASTPPGASRATAYSLPASAPTILSIPAIRVSSTLLHLGQAADGSLAVPPPGPHYDQAGWYRYSPTPGALGPAVIVGHIDSKSGGPSVFFRLGELTPGDTIRVSRRDGSVAVFAVDDVRRFHKADFPTQLVYGNTRNAALRLITCGGPFDRTTGHYLDNVVVTASLLRTS
ncbi:MAG: class sortase [Frankiales bacterium]|nr:class sortase [Frankiales bacterium]